MKYLRALTMSILLYLSTLLLMSIIWWFTAESGLWLRYIITYIVLVPMVLWWAKWYFRHDTSTAGKGAALGVLALIVGALLDLLFFALVPIFGVDTVPLLAETYGVWWFYLGLLEILVLFVYAGFEFDATYTATSDTPGDGENT